MMTVPRTDPGPVIPAAALFDAPGRPRPLARRLAIHNRVVSTIRAFFADAGYNEIPVTALADDPARVQLDGMLTLGFDAVWCESEIMPPGGKLEPRHLRGFKLMEAACSGLNAADISDLVETLLKTVAAGMSADLLGGRSVTRLDRMLQVRHPRLGYAEALALLAEKGWSVDEGAPLPLQARATLTRHFGNLPFLLLGVPAGARAMAAKAGSPDAVEYVLPYAGVAIEGESGPGADGRRRGRFELDLGRVLQYLMGLENITDTLIDPMDRIARSMHDVAPGTVLARTGEERA
jgi:hypothetical protein